MLVPILVRSVAPRVLTKDGISHYYWGGGANGMTWSPRSTTKVQRRSLEYSGNRRFRDFSLLLKGFSRRSPWITSSVGTLRRSPSNQPQQSSNLHVIGGVTGCNVTDLLVILLDLGFRPVWGLCWEVLRLLLLATSFSFQRRPATHLFGFHPASDKL